MSSNRFTAFTVHGICWLLISIILIALGNNLLLLVVTPIFLLDMWFALCLGFMLRLPKARENIEPPSGWVWEMHDVNSYPVRWLRMEMDPDKPLAILIHGWNSRASNMVGRSILYQKLGYNCILFEMRAHGGNARVPHWAAMHVCHDLETVLRLFDQRGWLSNGFLIHGHSLGGFVSQRVLRPELHTSRFARGVILESPVTSYEYINNQTCDYLRIPKRLQRPMMHRLLSYYNRLNPEEFQVSSIDFLRPPEWGLPRCPTLLVQAKHDSTLGLKHAELLIDVHGPLASNFTAHIVEDLKHAYESSNTTRDELIQDWIEEQSLFLN